MTGTVANGLPVLWHLKVSHYNEKVRWALDYKRVPHIRRAAVPGWHRSVARRLTGRTTFPVLVVDGRPIADSARIIDELERRHPAPPLYPADAAQRARALELERFFDEELGPYTRLLFVQHVLPDPALTLGSFFQDLSPPRRLLARAAFPAVRSRMAAAFAINERRVEEARTKVVAAAERFRAEVDPSGYLVGATFGVADLTLAALLAPIVAPLQFPYPQPQREHPRVAPLRELLTGCRLVEWTRDMYALHRGTSAEV